MSPTELQALRDEVENARRDRDRAAGRREAALTRLRDEHGCGTVKEAKRLAAKLKRELDEAERKLAVEFAAFRKRWKRRFKDGDEAS